MNHDSCFSNCDQTDHGPNPYVANIPCAARANENYNGPHVKTNPEKIIVNQIIPY